MRGASTAKRYAKFLFLYAKAVTGLKKWNVNCKTRPLSEYFTLTDEAFLLLCHESYTAKWLSAFQQGGLTNAAMAVAEPHDATAEIVLVSNVECIVLDMCFNELAGTNQFAPLRMPYTQDVLRVPNVAGPKSGWIDSTNLCVLCMLIAKSMALRSTHTCYGTSNTGATKAAHRLP